MRSISSEALLRQCSKKMFEPRFETLGEILNGKRLVGNERDNRNQIFINFREVRA